MHCTCSFKQPNAKFWKPKSSHNTYQMNGSITCANNCHMHNLIHASCQYRCNQPTCWNLALEKQCIRLADNFKNPLPGTHQTSRYHSWILSSTTAHTSVQHLSWPAWYNEGNESQSHPHPVEKLTPSTLLIQQKYFAQTKVLREFHTSVTSHIDIAYRFYWYRDT